MYGTTLDHGLLFDESEKISNRAVPKANLLRSLACCLAMQGDGDVIFLWTEVICLLLCLEIGISVVCNRYCAYEDWPVMSIGNVVKSAPVTSTVE